MKRKYSLFLSLICSVLFAACGGGGGGTGSGSAAASSSAKAITSFSLGGVVGTISEADKTIAVGMASTTSVTALVAAFTTTGASVKVGATVQASGTTPNNFTYPVTYTVTAADGTMANYLVTAISQSLAYQIDYAHTGHSNMAGPVSFPATPTWSVALSGVASYPLIAGGKVFVLTAPGAVVTTKQLYALDKATGALVWGPIAIPGTYAWAGHAYDRGKVFVVNFDGLLKAFDANTGVAGWSVQTSSSQVSSPPTAINGIVYVGGYQFGGMLDAVDEATGTILWTKTMPLASGQNSSPAVSSDGVFVSYACQKVYKFAPLTGAPLWSYSGPCSGGGGKTAAYSNGFLYTRDFNFTTATYGQYIYNAATGVPVGNFTTTSTIPALTAQTQYMMSTGTLQAVDLVTHNPLWSFVGDGKLVSAPITINQYVIVGSSAGNVYAVNSATGAQAWSSAASGVIAAPDEQNVSQPLTGTGAGEGYLIVPAGNVLSAWHVAP